jgi:hypothetical protein
MMLVAPTHAATVDCEPARCAVQAAINQACPCDGPQFKNHGRYVSCVAHVVKRLSKDGTIPTKCKGKIKRCAARSTCNKPVGFVTCTVPVEFGTCDLLTSTCTTGVSALGTCGADSDCVVSTRCKIKRGADKCTVPGAVIGSGTCCAGCVTPVVP